jgi:hypothetical protein
MEEVKLSLFLDNIILYLKKSKDRTKKLSDRINSFNNVAGFKIHTKNQKVSYKLTVNFLRKTSKNNLTYKSLNMLNTRSKPNYTYIIKIVKH